MCGVNVLLASVMASATCKGYKKYGWVEVGATRGCSQRLNRQKSARAKMSARAKKGRCKEGPSKKRGQSKCENPNRCKTGNLAASAQATNFGLSVTTCHQDLSVLSE